MHRLALILAAGCSSSSAEPPKDAAVRTDESGGLRISLEVPAVVARKPPAQGAQAITATLHFENRSAKPIRILLVGPEPFRLFNSSLRVWRGNDVVSLQPEPHPHGYLISEKDFFVIAAGASKTFPQTLYVTDRFTSPGAYEIEWMYENKQRKFPGGANTLDGVTKPLFGGKDVEDLWVGSLSTRAKLRLD
jgi:hypothetical protein